MIAGVLSLLALSGGTASASQDPYRDQAEKIDCPAGPSGWVTPPESAGGRIILTPLTALVQTDDPTMFFSAPVVQVDCVYRAQDGKDFDVTVRYALPIDINPWNDFYIGCTITGHPQNVATGPHAWDGRGRIYRVVGAKTWSLATFIDDLGQLSANDVPRFEAIADELLKAAQPFAHDCTLAGGGGPVDIKSIWTWSFNAKTTAGGVTSTAGTTGSFVTTASPSGTGAGVISNLFADDFRLEVTGGGTPRWLAIHVAGPIEFRHGYGSLLRAHLVVLGSNDARCGKGAAGTLLLSLQYLTPPRVEVKLCGHTYLAGKGEVRALMKTV